MSLKTIIAKKREKQIKNIYNQSGKTFRPQFFLKSALLIYVLCMGNCGVLQVNAQMYPIKLP